MLSTFETCEQQLKMPGRIYSTQNSDHQQCQQCLVVKSGTINLSSRQGTKLACKQCHI